ncbi:MAG: DNA methyltransferase [Bacteroidetes bacterium]|jgi:DNA modification methylase|nr:MAG: DNA methyltransferase [Anaerolineae bacterium]RME18093.1 MAG: DNA methyltransferase [Bacteroidota bacterium]
MLKTTQLSFIESLKREKETDDWTFNGASTREITHCYHDYPARMIPQVAGKLLDLFGISAKYLFDPYCGSGTSLVEANIRGINAYGTDLNPLARLIAKAKTATPDIELLEKQIAIFTRMALSDKLRKVKEMPEIYGISRLDFWFKPVVIDRLVRIRAFINEITNEEIRLFFQVAFSETVRESSNTRNEEFKLYRYNEEKLAKFNPDVYGIMSAKLQRNLEGYKKFKAIIDNLKHPPFTNIYSFNTVNEIPEDLIQPESIDIVVTSPPYGDSGTTVAYGQYSRLSAAWLELEEPDKIDRKLMGGKPLKDLPLFPSDSLNIAINEIRKADEKRAREVASFYVDLLDSISNVAKVIKKGGYACYVVGNRKVKGVVLPTDIAVRNFFENHGFEHVNTFIRSIPNKRMPSKNSPTNAAGVLDSTMTQEYIVVMRCSSTNLIR